MSTGSKVSSVHLTEIHDLWTVGVFLFDSFLLCRVYRVGLINGHFIFCSSLFFCPFCNVSVKSPQTKTHLEVFVEVKSLPRASVKVAVSILCLIYLFIYLGRVVGVTFTST